MKNEFGTLHNVTGRYALQFERSFSKSKEEVFQVLTNAHSFSKFVSFRNWGNGTKNWRENSFG